MTNPTPGSRIERLLSGIDKQQLGLEIAPFFTPLVPKRDGYNVKTLDVRPVEFLREQMRNDPAFENPDDHVLEDIDYIGSATEVAALVPAELHGTFDYVISSHNFEHLPNPLKFLAGCEEILKPGGALVMAVPDARGCFDLFRSHTVLSNWLEAWIEDRDRPTQRDVFDLNIARALVLGADGRTEAYTGTRERDVAFVAGDIRTQFDSWTSQRDSEEYFDTHCTVMTPASLELLLVEARALGIISFEIDLIKSLPGGMEFQLRLRRPKGNLPEITTDDLNRSRTQLHHRILKERMYEAPIAPSKKVLRRLFGDGVYNSARAWNAQRRRRSKANGESRS